MGLVDSVEKLGGQGIGVEQDLLVVNGNDGFDWNRKVTGVLDVDDDLPVQNFTDGADAFMAFG